MRSSFVHDWSEQGWAPFRRLLINPDGSTSFAPTAVGDRGRVTGTGTSGNRREAWLHNAALFGEESSVRSLWWGGSAWDAAAALPQLGHIHRAQQDEFGNWRGYVVTNNIFASEQNTINANLWSWPPAGNSTAVSPTGPNGTAKAMPLERRYNITAVARIFAFGSWLNQYYVNPRPYGLAVPDRVTTDSSFAAFDETDVAVSAVDVGGGIVTIVESVTLSGVAITPDAGTLSPLRAKKHWPYWIESKLTGQALQVKAWRLGETEPDWSEEANVLTADFAGAQTPRPNFEPAVQRGYSGIVACHLRNSEYLEFGQVTFAGS